MKCPYCAEEIKDEAILCRFCGARRVSGGWTPPLPPSLKGQPVAAPAAKSNITIRTAAVFFLASAVFEVFSLGSAIPLFGAVRGGVVAVGYHLIYAGLFLAMGIGLWTARRWGYTVMLGGTIFYTLDKLIYITEHKARALEIKQQLQGYGVQDMIDPNSMLAWMDLLAVLTVACWWGFMVYLYFKRSYFEEAKSDGEDGRVAVEVGTDQDRGSLPPR